MSFGEKLRKERERLGLTQAQCAKLLEVSLRSLEMWERGEGNEPAKYKQVGALTILKEQPAPKG